MSDARYESELVKSLHRLDEILNKAQIEDKRTGHPRDHWGDGEVHVYDSDEDTAWQDSIEEDGTDYDGPKKEKKRKMSKAQGYDDREDESMGMRDGKEADKKEDEKDRRDDSYGKWGKRDEEHDDDDKVDKSVRTGVEVSEFLGELTKSIAIYCNDLEDSVIKSIAELHTENGEVVKSLAYNLSVVSDLVNGSKENLVKYADGPARGPKSYQHMSKSVPSQDTLDKSSVIGLLVKGVEAGTVSPLEVIKCEQYGPGAVSQNVLKSLTA